MLQINPRHLNAGQFQRHFDLILDLQNSPRIVFANFRHPFQMTLTLKLAKSLLMIDATLPRKGTHNTKASHPFCRGQQGVLLRTFGMFVIFIRGFIYGDIPVPTTNIRTGGTKTFEFI
jgi:hypothetical protein